MVTAAALEMIDCRQCACEILLLLFLGSTRAREETPTKPRAVQALAAVSMHADAVPRMSWPGPGGSHNGCMLGLGHHFFFEEEELATKLKKTKLLLYTLFIIYIF